MESISKINNKNYRLDLSNNRISFLDSRFYYHEAGKYYPSVTTILEAYPRNAGFYDWLKRAGENADEIRDEAGRRGSIVHNLTEMYDRGEEVNLLGPTGDISVKLSEWSFFSRYVEFRNRFPFAIEHMELNMVSDKLQFGGTLDRVINLNGKRILFDIKTSNSLYNHFWLQMAAYARLFEEEQTPVDAIAILWLNAKTRTDGKNGAMQGQGWQLIIESDQKAVDKYWKLFIATMKLWMEENAGMQPRQIQYQLKHKLQ